MGTILWVKIPSVVESEGLEEKYQTKPLAVKRVFIDKRGKDGEKRSLDIPAIKDRVCQQALDEDRQMNEATYKNGLLETMEENYN